MDKQNATQAKRLSRRFLGKTEFIIDRSTPKAEYYSKQERHFWQRMLRAYHKGQLTFVFNGRINHPDARKVDVYLMSSDLTPRYYVNQEYYKI